VNRFERFHLLEEKILQTIDWINQMEARCQTLQNTNKELEIEILELRNHHNQLTQEIERLEAARHQLASKSKDNIEIKKRIDKMLKKFEELQI
jgi:FtsZ-binding cell division protein ZapB